MADLKYPCSSSPPAATFTLESDDISTLLNSLLQNSSLPSTSPFSAPPPAPPGSADLRSQFAGSAALSDSAAAAIGCFGFPFRCGGGGGSYAPAADDSDRSGTVLPAAIPSSSAERFGDLDFDSERDQDAYDVLRESALATGARSSSKRSRAAEVHNLSEKRRRQKINEKLKALQKLIPNSNKTDKASMLDEAIEYLKQLQLQVQMLAMRNGWTLHPFYTAGGMHPAHSVQVGTSYNDGDGVPTCTSQGIGTMLAHGEMPFNNIYMPSNECDSSGQKIFMHKPIAGTSNSERSLLGPSTTAHCRPYMTNMPSNELCGGDMKPPQLQLDMARCGTESSSGISS